MSELVRNPRVLLLHKAQSEEALRLHAPVPFLLPRQCREACQVVMGYDVPKGTKVFVNVWTIERDDKFWGDGEGNYFEFIPFGAGRRICPGIMHGLANMELVLMSLLYHFDWEEPNNSGDLDMTEAFATAEEGYQITSPKTVG
ncbi:hypothetical protein SORBI_3001G176100 [Sorghum bicolor]|uniref:Cytochrome P450 n=1 Tax=Sorghum bicolor TaxID=4558 RepID=C5WTB3_SORBI|nr:hypothetical protein SORBI_3001G176100 [Sorghum bicolor]